MITNKIILIIISITAIIVIPVQLVTTLVLGILFSITFGLLLIPFSIIWIVLFYGPLIGLSYLYERVKLLRPFIVIIGIPIAVIGDTYVALIPSMGEMESRFSKMIICQSFPYSWRFVQFLYKGRKEYLDDNLTSVLISISEAKDLGKYIKSIMAED